MKAVLFAIALVAGSSAFAASNKCQTIFIGTGEGGQGYYQDTCPTPVKHRSCIEGEIGYFPTGEFTSEGGSREVARVCKNGSFFPKAAPVQHRQGCVEGEITYISTGTYTSEGGAYEYPVVCRSGRFVRAN